MDDNTKSKDVSRNCEAGVENFKENVIGWSKLAAIGARPIAESVEINREMYARVLNKRRELPDADANKLGRALGLTVDGFVPQIFQSNLCRNLEDLKAIEDLGFKIRYLAQIKTKKEMNGGLSLQKYVAIHFTYMDVGRISIMRMATEKWLKLIASIENQSLPTLPVDTLVMPHFNAIAQEVDAKNWEKLTEYLNTNDKINLVAWIQEQLDHWLENQTAHIKAQDSAKRINRKTHLIRLTEKNSTLSDWPIAVRELSATHFLIPVTTEFAPVQAVGMRNDESRVFVYTTVLNKDELFNLPKNLGQPLDHALIFMQTDKRGGGQHELIFDGPVSSLIDLGGKSVVTGQKNDPNKLDTTTIFFTNRLIESGKRLMMRKDVKN